MAIVAVRGWGKENILQRTEGKLLRIQITYLSTNFLSFVSRNSVAYSVSPKHKRPLPFALQVWLWDFLIKTNTL